MVVSLKSNKTRIIAFLILAAVVIGACVLLHGGGETEPQKVFSGGTNEERIVFLESFGWKVGPEAAETREVMIPSEFNDVYTTYNVMQKAQGFDLKPYAGEVCTQYKYKIKNYPGESEVYATLLVKGEKIIGGDVACAEVDGFMHGFAADSARYGETSGGSASSKAPDSGKKKKDESSSSESSSSSENSSSAEICMEETSDEDPEAQSTAGEPIPEDVYPTD